MSDIQPEPAYGKWLPIETAPRDGTQVLINCATTTRESFVAFFDTAIWMFYGKFGEPGSIGLKNPTHWMPLPEPPCT